MCRVLAAGGKSGIMVRERGPAVDDGIRLTIFIPAYNEAEGLPAVLQRLVEAYGDDPGVEILVVDDGSTDGTAEAARAFAGVTVVSHRRNKGNGAAVKTGLRAARGEVMVILDADGQHDPADIDRLVSQVGEFDLVVGARTAESDSSAFRDFGNRVMARSASYLANCPIPDLTSGFRAFKLRLMRQFLHLFPDGFSFPSTSTMCFLTMGYEVKFEPVTAKRRQAGKSKIRPFRDGLRFMRIIMRLALLFNPSRVFVPVGTAFLLFGIGWGAYKLTALHQGLSVFALALVMTGMFVILLGVLAEQLSQILRQLSVRERGGDV